MSAPVRSSLNENSKNILANKKKPRRRKFLARSTTIDKTTSSLSSNENHIINASYHNLNENDENYNAKSSKSNNNNNNHNRKTLNKIKNSIGCDVVTLVSMISSEGSDSEKEEINQQITGIDNQIKRAPFLRKTGKSGMLYLFIFCFNLN